ncbi:MAG: hypothetical protein Q4F79_12605 [Eubacteriales bacterium]|nr:hypothetical protein [Eubacteriales bacterium]
MSITVDELKIQVEADAKAASSGIDSLVESLTGLKNVTSKGISGISKVSDNLTSLSAASRTINSSGMRTAASSMKSMADGIRALSGASLRGMKANANQMESLVTPVSKIAGISGNNFRLNAGHIAAGMTSLSSAGKLTMTSTVRQLDALYAPIERIALSNGTGFASNIKYLADGLNAISGASKVSLRGTINQLSELPAVINSISATSMDAFVQSMRKLAPALNSLSEVGRVNLRSTLNQLKQLPEVADALEKVDFTRFTQKVRAAANALKQLPTYSNSARSSLLRLPSALNSATSAANRNTTANKKNASSYGAIAEMARKITTTAVVIRMFTQIAHVLAGCLGVSNDYVETLNLFNTEMGEAAGAAREYAEAVNAALGIDVAEWMKNQGNLMQIVSGFGVASDAATVMSQNLTQLGYDIASFFNATDMEQPFERIRSAMAGETEGMRQYGVDMTVASMQAYMLQKGIDAQWSSLDQASKAMIRYNYLIEKFNILEGDMARTIQSPANALRVLSSQFTQLRRAVGNIVSVFAAKLIPYVQLAVVAIRKLANSLAALLGYQLDWNDSSTSLGNSFAGLDDASDSVGDLSSGTDGLTGSTKKATAAAKELKRQLMGFDEINRLSDTSPTNSGSTGAGGSGGSGGGGSGGSTHLDLDPLSYDFLKGVTAATMDLSEAFKKLQELTGWNFEPLAKSLTRLKEACGQLAEIGKGALLWVWENVLKPLGKWTIEAGLPAVVNMLAAAFELLAAALEYLKPYAQWAWDHFLRPLASWTGNAFVEACETITEALEYLTRQFKENPDAVGNFIAGVGTAVGAIAALSVASTVTPIIMSFGKIVGSAGTALSIIFESITGGEGLLAGLGAVFGDIAGEGTVLGTALGTISKLFNPITAAVGLVIAIFVDLMLTSEDFRSTVSGAISKVWNAAKEAFGSIATTVGGVIAAFGKCAKAIYAFYTESGLKTLVGGVLGMLIDMLASGLSGALKIVSGAFKGAGKIIEIVVGAVTAIFEGLTKLCKWVKNGNLDALIQAFTGMVSGAVGVGVNIVKGILSGMWDGIKGIGNWIKTNVVDKFINTIKKFFGIHSPATKMKPIGKYIFQGILSGIIGAVKGIGSWIKKQVIDKFVSGLKAKIKAAKDFVKQGKEVFNKIKSGVTDGVKNVGSWLKTNVVDKLSSGLKDKISAAKDLVTRGGEVLGKVKDGIKSGMSDAGDWVKDHILTPISDAIGDGKDKVTTAISSLTDGASATVEAGVKLVQNGWTNVQSFVEALKGGDVNKAIGIVQNGWTNLKNWVDEHTGGAASKAIGIVKSGWDTVKGFIDDHTGGAVSKAIDLAKNKWDDVTSWIKDNGWGAVPSKVIDLAKNGWDTVGKWISKSHMGENAIALIDRAKNWTTSFKEWIMGKNGTTDGGTASIGRAKNWTTSFKEWIMGKNGTTDGGTANISRAKGWKTSFKEWIMGKKGTTNGGTANISRAKGWKTSMKRWLTGNDKGTISLTAKVTRTYGVGKSYTNGGRQAVAGRNRANGGVYTAGAGWTPITSYAGGGLPDEGQMFIAREAGPELVGTLGGSTTAVMNNDQIVASVSYGVQQAVAGVARDLVAALSGGKSNQPIIVSVQLDGKEVGRASVEYHNNVVMSTGRSPLLV